MWRHYDVIMSKGKKPKMAKFVFDHKHSRNFWFSPGLEQKFFFFFFFFFSSSSSFFFFFFFFFFPKNEKLNMKNKFGIKHKKTKNKKKKKNKHENKNN